MKSSVIFFSLFIFASVATGQDFFHDESIVLTGHYGYIWAHREKIEHIVTGHTTGFEISLQRQTDGSKWWQEVHGYPQTGFTFVHLYFANEKVLGTADGLISYINFHIVKKKSFLFSFHMGAGLGYLSKRWQRTGDYKNLAIGSHLNAAIQFMGDARFRISEKIFLNLNYGITHFSDGAFHVPNLGLNNVSLNGGIAYQFSEPEKYLTPEIPALDNRWQVDVLYGVGVKESYPPAGKQFFAHTLCASLLKPLNHKNEIGIGVDAFYDLSLQRVIIAEGKSEFHRKIFRSGIHLAYELLVNKITILGQIGGYVIDNVKQDGSIYHRVGMKYAINENLFANLSLKTHFFRADFVELGVGWKFRLGKERIK